MEEPTKKDCLTIDELIKLPEKIRYRHGGGVPVVRCDGEPVVRVCVSDGLGGLHVTISGRFEGYDQGEIEPDES